MQGYEVVPRQYAYLDQNIIIYTRDEIREGSTDTPLLKAILKLKNQGAIFPYSQAHLLDFFSNDLEAKSQYASEDLNILSTISDNKMLGTTWDGNRLLLLLAQLHPREALA